MVKARKLFQGDVVRLSHSIFQETIVPGDVVVDATCGNGKDSAEMARLLQGQGRLIAYDVQEKALEQAREFCSRVLSPEEFSVIEFKHCSHEYIEEVGVKVFHYNLGYLPGGDKHITTLEKGTKASLVKALTQLAPGGVITVVCYPGHEEGERERVALEQLCKGLDPKLWEVGYFYIMNRNKAPRLLLIRSLSHQDGRE